MDKLLTLINLYLDDVAYCISLFKKKYGDNYLIAPRLFQSVKGFLDEDKKIEYFYHGIGCCVEFSDRVVDWDFGHTGINGFDLWRLQWYWLNYNNTKIRSLFSNEKELESNFKTLINSGFISQRFIDHEDYLYYL